MKNYCRFGAEFPIRFDFLDTIDGENLSLQVPPLTEYIKPHFGMTYTQNEKLLLDCKDDGGVYLGLKEGIDKNQMLTDLKCAQEVIFHLMLKSMSISFMLKNMIIS